MSKLRMPNQNGFTTFMKTERGFTPAVVVILAALGIIIYLLISSTFPFKDKLFSLLYPKPISRAATTDTSYNLKVLVLKYFPLTADGQNIDIAVTGDVGDPYTLIRQRTIDITSNLKIALEKATRYLGYQDLTAQPALTYQILDTKEYTQAVPMLTDGTRRPNYNAIMTTHNICDWVDNKGVREVWLWAYQGPTYPGSSYPYLGISESKMAGPYGDISNSWRTNDMPTCLNTYRVYTFNYGRWTAEALESWGHQMEAELDAIDWTLFRKKFQGPNYPQTLGVNGRCGSVHNPPNARWEYDSANSTPQSSDCLDWNPDSLGTLSSVSCLNWGCQEKNQLNDNPGLNYMIWNWQNLPGRNNTKTYEGQPLRNWWDVHGDFDKVMGQDRSLFLPGPYPDPNEAYTERTADSWSCDSSDKAACAVSDDSLRVMINSYSVKVTTSSGFDFWTFYPKAKNANWDLTDTNYLVFWVYSDNPNAPGYQGNFPVIDLKNSAGSYYRYTPSSNLLATAEKRWKQFKVPLAGDSTWIRTSSGAVSLSDIDYLEIHADTWDYGFTLWLDGMYFSPAPSTPIPTPTPTPTPAPSCSVSPGTNQLKGCLWDGINFNTADGDAPDGTSLSAPVTDAATAIDQNWTIGEPNPIVGPDQFSGRWQGNFTFKDGTYTFYAGADDGVRLKIDGSTKIDSWIDTSYTERSYTQTFSSQATHLIELEYYENGGDARVSLRWTYTPPATPTPTPTPTSTPSPSPTPTPTPPPIDTQPPTAPTNLTANPVSSSQINLSWNPSTDNIAVSGYDVYRNSTKVATITTTSYGDTGLSPSTTYTYFVKAYDAAGNISSPSNTVSVTTQPALSYGAITGTVYFSAGGVVSGVRVSIKVGKSNNSYLTNSLGVFNIVNIPPGSYNLTFRKSGYVTQDANVSVSSGGTVILRITLTKK